MSEIQNVFAADGALAAIVPNFRARPGQIEMAEAIKKTVQNQQVIIAEAGTGTGKTLAYLVPAVLSGRRVLISTGTRTLQDQIFYKDLPELARGLDREIREIGRAHV